MLVEAVVFRGEDQSSGDDLNLDLAPLALSRRRKDQAIQGCLGTELYL